MAKGFSWDDNPDLNITPLVDVMLVLMAILMVTAPTITFQEKIRLPEGSKSAKVSKVDALTLRMDAKRNVYMGKEHYPLDAFADAFGLKSARFDKKRTIYIRADERLSYKEVMRLLGIVKRAGFHRVSLVTQ